MDNQNSNAYLVSGIFIGWIAVSVICIMCFKQQGMPWLVVATVGQLFGGFGVAAFIASLPEKKFAPLPLLFILIGALIAGFGLIQQYGEGDAAENLMEMLPYLFLGIFVVVGVGAVILVNLYCEKLKARCCYEISGLCVDYTSMKAPDGKYIQYPTYEFFYNGEYRRATPTVFGGNTTAVGGNKKLLMNPSDPEEVIESGKIVGLQVIGTILGLIFVLSGFAGMLLYSM